MERCTDTWTLQKYLLYDFAGDQLASPKLFASYEQAAHAAGRRSSVMIIALAVSQLSAQSSADVSDGQHHSQR